MATPVIFRKLKDRGEIIALFPTVPGTRDPWTCESYMHVGQHGRASVELFYDSLPVRGTEYLPLLAELEQLGYDDLRIYRRYQARFTMLRLTELKRA